MEKPDAGLEPLNEAESILRALVSGSPGNTGYRQLLADTINAQGFIYFERGHSDDALRAFQEFHQICQSLLDDQGPDRKPAQLLNSLALSCYNMGAILYQRDHHKALEIYEQSLAYRRLLVDAASFGQRFPGKTRDLPHRDRSAPPRSRPAR